MTDKVISLRIIALNLHVNLSRLVERLDIEYSRLGRLDNYTQDRHRNLPEVQGDFQFMNSRPRFQA